MSHGLVSGSLKAAKKLLLSNEKTRRNSSAFRLQDTRTPLKEDRSALLVSSYLPCKVP